MDELSQQTWKSIESSDGSLPIARHEAAFVKVKHKFYLLGGRGLRNVSIFDAKKQQWTKGSKPPLELHHFQPIVYQNKIYVIGALTGKYPSETPVGFVYIYDPENDTWIKGDEIPEDRRRGSTGNVLQGDSVFITCGISNGHIDGHKKWLDRYNLKTGEWTILKDAPRTRDHFQAVRYEDNIYLLGGRRSKAPNATFTETIGVVDVFNIKNGNWTSLKNEIPTQRAGNMAVVRNDTILVIGGESLKQQTAHNEVEALDTKTHVWSTYSPLLRGRHGTGLVKYKGAIYTASGSGNRGGAPELTTMEKLK